MNRKKTNDYHAYWIKKLRGDKELAIEHLNVALEEEDPRMFLRALRNVAEAYGGFSKLAKEAKVDRSNLYKMLSEKGGPEIQTLEKLLSTFGLQFKVVLKSAQRFKKAA
jgi:probable addiction module antidote protein